MSDSGFSLIDMKGISEPLTKLIDVVSNGIGAIYEPTRKVRNAKAEAKAMLILAEAEHKSNTIATRAIERVNYREIRRQNNIDSIVRDAAMVLPKTVSSKPVSEDWIVNFFELCQDVGNEEMKQIWSKLLAGEVAKPGSFKPRTLQAVKSLTPEEARMFTTLCSFAFVLKDDEYFFPIFSHGFFQFVRKNGLSADTETHLKNIGLLSHAKVWSSSDEKFITIHYFSKAYDTALVSGKSHEKAELEKFPFTEIGKELAPISGAQPNEEYEGGRIVLHSLDQSQANIIDANQEKSYYANIPDSVANSRLMERGGGTMHVELRLAGESDFQLESIPLMKEALEKYRLEFTIPPNNKIPTADSGG